MIHIDIKKLGRFNKIGHRITGGRTGQSNSRGVGWEFVHVGIDDHSRIAFSQIKPDEKADSAVPFLKTAVAYYGSLRLPRPRHHPHPRPEPYTPKTNGKAERFIQTALRQWAYALAYPTSDCRAEELPAWLRRYNWHRPHGGIKSQPPISRLGLTSDNLLRLHI